MRRHSEQGFTLLELLVAMSLAALLSLVLFGGLHFGRRVWEASELATANQNQVRRFVTDLGQTLQRAYPEMIATDATHRSVAFTGEPDKLSWLSESDPGHAQMTQMSVRREGETILESARGEFSTSPQVRTSARLTHVADIAFAYFGPPKDGDDPAWLSRWENRSTLPQLIRIRIRFTDPRLKWPELIVAPRITADEGCLFDPLTKTCQGT